MDRLTSMAVFVRCADLGSLAGAARAAGLSHAMVSKHVRALEQTLGVRLIDVTTRRLSLTEAGRRYYDRCIQILAEVDDAALEAAAHQSTPRGLLRITGPAIFGELHLAPVLARFMAANPQVSIEAEFTDRYVHLVEEGFDLAVRIGRLPDSSLIVRRLGAIRMLTCASPGFLQAFGPPERPEALAGRPCLRLSSATTPDVWWYTDAGGAEIKVRVEGPLKANSMSLLRQAAEQDAGLIFGPSFALGPLVEAGRLVTVLDAYPSRALDLNALLPSHRRMPLKVRALLDALVEAFSDAARSQP
jgi:DNA-binding transcriptional LysR family regulator